MKFLFTGLGSIGKRHLRNLKSLGFNDIIAYKTKKHNAAEIEKEFGIKIFYQLDKALDQKPDVAFITNPTSLHTQTALEVAKRGCHIFMEKPLDCSFENVDELEALINEKSLVFFIAYNFRFAPHLKLAKKFLEGGKIGRVVSARAQVGQYLPDWHPREDYQIGYYGRRDLGGGPILTLIHEIDYLYWLFGDAKEVFCFSDKLTDLEIDTDDTVEILLRFSNGVLGEIHLDYVQRYSTRSMQIIGDKGTILWDFNNKTLNLFTAGTGKWKSFESKDYNYNEMYIEELKNFLGCVKNHRRPKTDFNVAKASLQIALSAVESAKTGQLMKIEEVV